MKAQILKIAGVKSEAEFYKMYPTEEAFFQAHPEAQMMMRDGGEMIKRADGSYSKRGLWDNIRANRGSGKKPTQEMLEQERKINSKAQLGGVMGGFNMGMVQDKQNQLMGMADDLQKKYGPMLMQLAPMLLQDGGEPTPAQIMQQRQQKAQQMVQAADVLTNMFMKKGGSTYSGGVWFQDGGRAPMMMNEGYHDPNWAMKSMSEEVDRAGDATVLSERGARLQEDKLRQERKKKLYWDGLYLNRPVGAGPMTGPDLAIYEDNLRGQLVQQFGTMKNGDFFPNQAYFDQRGRVPSASRATSNPLVEAYAKKAFKKGGSTYSGGVWFQDGGMSNFNSKLSAVQNKLAEGMNGSPELDAIGSIIEGINNKRDYNDALEKQKLNYSTDYAYNTSYSTPANKGQYDMYGTMMPSQIGGNLSFNGMNQKYNMVKNMYEVGGAYANTTTSWIPKEVGMPEDAPFFVAAPKANTFEMVPTKAAPSVESVTRMNFNLQGNFQDYAGKAQRYLDKVAPNTDIKGADLAAAAQVAYQKHGEIVPVELALAQLKQEGYLATGSKQNKPQRTKNPFNVGNTDDGSTVSHNSLYSGIQAYYNLMASQYLKGKSPQELLNNFTNTKGNRYASDKKYEDSLKQIIGGMKLKEGGEYELTEAQIQHIMKMGGQIEYC